MIVNHKLPAFAITTLLTPTGIAHADGDETYRERFERLDRNSDGYISKREKNHNRIDKNNDGRIGPKEHTFNRADKNNDGYINKREDRQAKRRARRR